MAHGLTTLLLRAVVAIPVFVAAFAQTNAAPILGETQLGQAPAQNPADQTVTEPDIPPITPTIVGTKSTVIEFTILPSASDPDVLETTIILQQAGDAQVCVNHASQDIIVRSYESEADPFSPDIPSTIEGRDSGNVGELAGFNNEKVYIKPRSPDDRFERPDEAFTVGGFEGVFIADEVLCDEELTEGEVVCVDEVIRSQGCALVEHASLERELRLMLALNSIPLIAPAAGGPFGPDADPVFGVGPQVTPGGGLPSGPIGAAPVFPGPGRGSGGGGGLITVPNVIGLPLSNAMSAITASGFTVGSITASQGSSTGLFDGLLIGTAYAQGAFPPGVTGSSPVVDQTPPGGTPASPGSAVGLVAQAGEIPVPEPSTFSLFLFALLLALAGYGYARIRSRRASAPA